jgi:fructokinase
MASDELQNAGDAQGPIVVGLGEALFDCFADSRHIGGAPLNTAVHCDALLSACGGRGVIASAVGDDELGREFATFLQDRGLEAQFIQADASRPTGRVFVDVDARGEPSYRIEENVAWDHLQYDGHWQRLANNCAAVSFGTLAQRSPTSRATIQQFLRDATQAIRLFDVNLRQNYFSADVIRESLELASAAKLNADELQRVTQMLGFATPDGHAPDEAAFQLKSRFCLDWIAVTRGSQGTSLFAHEQEFTSAVRKYEAVPGANTVGAGDACGAGLLVGTLLHWPYQRRVDLANHLGAYVCSRPGAIAPMPESLLARVAADQSSTLGQ